MTDLVRTAESLAHQQRPQLLPRRLVAALAAVGWVGVVAAVGLAIAGGW